MLNLARLDAALTILTDDERRQVEAAAQQLTGSDTPDPVREHRHALVLAITQTLPLARRAAVWERLRD